MHLQGDGPLATADGRPGLTAALETPEPFLAASGMVLRFRYRTTLAPITVSLGNYSAVYVPKARPGQWGDAEIPLKAFSFEGVPLLPSDPVGGVRFSGILEARSGALDVDQVHFTRRSR